MTTFTWKAVNVPGTIQYATYYVGIKDDGKEKALAETFYTNSDIDHSLSYSFLLLLQHFRLLTRDSYEIGIFGHRSIDIDKEKATLVVEPGIIIECPVEVFKYLNISITHVLLDAPAYSSPGDASVVTGFPPTYIRFDAYILEVFYSHHVTYSEKEIKEGFAVEEIHEDFGWTPKTDKKPEFLYMTHDGVRDVIRATAKDILDKLINERRRFCYNYDGKEIIRITSERSDIDFCLYNPEKIKEFFKQEFNVELT